VPKYSFDYIGITIPPSDPFPHGQTVFRPYLIANLTAGNGKTFRCIVWPDSGADHCVFPVSFAIALGLDPLTMKQQLTGGVGNTGNTTFYADLQIDIENGPTFKTFCGFTPGLEAQGLGLLGQIGFFENFIVSFDHKNRMFHIE
jgi:hypothetical protein